MIPSSIKLHTKTATLELKYSDGGIYTLGAELLRVHSPSAEVRGHGQGQEILQTGKRMVKLLNIEAMGNYAIKLHFDDDHNTGIYTWEYLRSLSLNQTVLWQEYIEKLDRAGESRDDLPADTQVLTFTPLKSN